MPQSETPKGHYVYRLIDPRNGQSFYIGKGVGRRAWQHEAQAAAGKRMGSGAKNEMILEILALDLSVGVEIVETFNTADEALALEHRLIRADPTLVNERSGYDPAVVIEHKLKRLKTAKASAANRKAAGQAYFRRKMEQVRRLTGSKASLEEAERFFARQAADYTARSKLVNYHRTPR